MLATRVILLEFNELSPPVMDRFIGSGKLPNFARLQAESQIFTTESEVGPPNLEPWIQWVTVHTGMPYSAHGIFNLDEGYKLREKCIWDLVSDGGGQVWVCGSMNVQYQRPLRGWVVPDAWTSKVAAQPADELRPYVHFVSANVLEHTLDQASLTIGDKLRFTSFMGRHGLSKHSVTAIARQLMGERSGYAARWQRAAILDRLQFDLFRWVYRRERPALSTFFSNSTAHFQHLYWRNMEPEVFQVRPTPAEQAQYADAVLFGYQQVDELLGQFMDLAGDETTLVFCTALSQQPCLDYEEQGGKRWYRPRSFDRFLHDAGIDLPAQITPVMAHEFHIDFESEAAAAAAETQLAALRYVGDKQAMVLTRSGRRILTGCRVFEDVPPDSRLTVAGTERSIPFFQLFYRVEGIKSGMHHRDGMLWIRTPAREHRVESTKVPLVCVAPTLLEMFDVAKPDYMVGESLLRQRARAA